jgi:nucleoside-diphosphate-sugar epimerase
MKLLFTGASGFVGKNVVPSLKAIYQLSTLGNSQRNDYIFDISKETPVFHETFDVVVHAAGKAHSTPNSEGEKEEFFNVNLQGTKNLCKALEISGVPQSFIFISTVAVYGLESGDNISEDAPLNGNTPYALSKIAAEKFLKEWSEENKVKLSILRPSLIAGKDAPGNLGAMVNGLKSGRYLSIKDVHARKSVLMVDDISYLVERLNNKSGIFNICDDTHPTFKQLETVIAAQLRKKSPVAVPLLLIKILAKIGDVAGDRFPINSLKLKKMISNLTFSNEKAKKELQWSPTNVLDKYKI